jgi:hypothetical protein
MIKLTLLHRAIAGWYVGITHNSIEHIKGFLVHFIFRVRGQ